MQKKGPEEEVGDGVKNVNCSLALKSRKRELMLCHPYYEFRDEITAEREREILDQGLQKKR